MEPYSLPPGLPPLPPPTYEESDRNARQLPKTIQIIEYRVDVGKLHFSSQSTPGIKFLENETCICTIPYVPRDYEQIVHALPQFDRTIQEWQMTKHSTKDQELKLRFPYPTKTLWPVAPNITGVFTASARCQTKAKFVEAELHFNEKSMILSRGKSFPGGLHAVTFLCPPNIVGLAYVVFTLKNECSQVVDHEICIIDEEKRKRIGPAGVPVAVHDPAGTTMESNTPSMPQAKHPHGGQAKGKGKGTKKGKAKPNEATEKKVMAKEATGNEVEQNEVQQARAQAQQGVAQQIEFQQVHVQQVAAQHIEAQHIAAQQIQAQQINTQQAKARQNEAKKNEAKKNEPKQSESKQNEVIQPQQLEFIYANQMQLEYSEAQLPQQPENTPLLPMAFPPLGAATPCNTPYESPYPAYHVENSPIVAQPIECPPVNFTAPYNTPYEFQYPNYSVGDPCVIAQPIECPPVHVTVPCNPVYEYRYPNYTVDNSSVIAQPMDFSAFDDATTSDFAFDPPSPTSSVESSREMIIQPPWNDAVYRVIDKFLWQRRDILWNEVGEALPEDLVRHWPTMNSRWYGRKRALEKKNAVRDLSCLFKNAETRRRARRGRPRPIPGSPKARSMANSPVDTGFQDLVASTLLESPVSMAEQLTLDSLPYRPLPSVDGFPVGIPMPMPMPTPVFINETGGAFLGNY